VSTFFAADAEEGAMHDEDHKLNDVWLPAIVITAINGGLFLAFFAGLAGL
jgi:hypothetical protein